MEWVARTSKPTLAKHIKSIDPRVKKLLSLPLEIKYIYLRLHQCDTSIELLNTSPHPLEPYIDLVDTRAEQVANAVGMLVPIGSDLQSYVSNNIIDYRWCITDRPSIEDDNFIKEYRGGLTNGELIELLRRYRDPDLFQLLELYVAADSRRQLLEKLASYLNGVAMFFVPLVRRCYNSETYLGEPTSNMDVFMIAYGTYQRYRCYEIEELIQNAKPDTIDLPDYVIEPEDLDGLQRLVKCYEVPRMDELLRKLRIIAEYDEGLTQIINIVKQWTSEQVSQLRTFFHTLFRLGMYMRSWDGVNSYPLLEIDTKGTNSTVFTCVTLVEMDTLMNSLHPDVKAVVTGLCLRRYKKGHLERLDSSIVSLYRNVIQGTECIRMASAYLVSSAHYYSVMILNEPIEGFDPDKLEPVA